VVSTALVARLGTAADKPLVQAATNNPHAHDLYLRARELSYRSDESSLNQAVTLFNQAISEDPNYAAARAGPAYTYLFIADAYRAPVDLLPVMKGAAEKAVALDPRRAESHAYLSHILLSYQRDFPAAEREMKLCVARYSSVQAGARATGEQDYMAAICYAHLGDDRHARSILAQLESAARKRYLDHANLAEIHVALDDKDAAFKALEQAYSDRSQPLLNVWAGSGFRVLHGDPRFRALMDKIYARQPPRVAS